MNTITIEIEPDIDSILNQPINVPENVLNKINELKSNEMKLVKKIEKIKNDKIIKEKEENESIKIIYNELINKELNMIEIMNMTKTSNLSTIILKLNKYIKSRGDLWILKKKQIKGNKFYYFTPN